MFRVQFPEIYYGGTIFQDTKKSMSLWFRAFILMLIGFGRNIPDVMATRNLESNKDRILTILVNFLMSCSARLPIYVLFAGASFPEIRA